MSNIKEGDTVIYNDGSFKYEGVVQQVHFNTRIRAEPDFHTYAVVSFPKGEPCGKSAMLIPVDELRKKPQWRPVTGQVRIVHEHTGDYCNDVSWLRDTVHCNTGLPIRVEQLIEDES